MGWEWTPTRRQTIRQSEGDQSNSTSGELVGSSGGKCVGCTGYVGCPVCVQAWSSPPLPSLLGGGCALLEVLPLPLLRLKGHFLAQWEQSPPPTRWGSHPDQAPTSPHILATLVGTDSQCWCCSRGRLLLVGETLCLLVLPRQPGEFAVPSPYCPLTGSYRSGCWVPVLHVTALRNCGREVLPQWAGQGPTAATKQTTHQNEEASGD